MNTTNDLISEKLSTEKYYITLANSRKVIYDYNYRVKENINDEDIYMIPLLFFSKYEKSELLAIKELLEDPKKYFSQMFNKIQKKEDSYTKVYKEKNPAYHMYLSCPLLQSDYLNFYIPEKIRNQGKQKVQEYRDWFIPKINEVHPDKRTAWSIARFQDSHQSKWGFQVNIRAIFAPSSGITKGKNYKITELIELIDDLIIKSNQFYKESDKNTFILDRFGADINYFKMDKTVIKYPGLYSQEKIKQVLNDYDTNFKKPLKKYLPEYYRIKHNPDIALHGNILEELGFVACPRCFKKKETNHYLEI